jgi:predicted TPR repeat methyltransferase
LRRQSRRSNVVNRHVSVHLDVPAPSGVNATFWRLTLEEPLRDAVVIDGGTGNGRIALALAPLCWYVVGIDRDAAAVAEARWRAETAKLRNVRFVVGDVETPGVDLAALSGLDRPPDLVVAHLYLSDVLVEAAARCLARGKALVVAGLHVDHWRETGRPSRFAYDEDRVRRVLAEAGFSPESVSVEREVRRFATSEDALAGALPFEGTWRSDGRWLAYTAFVERGGRTLTRSHVVAKGRRS